MNSPEERLVHERRGPQVRREDEQHGERQLELLAGLQREVVDAALERHDPAVEKLTRLDLLPAEVVDDQHAAVRRGLHRRVVEPGCRVVAQLERIERQLAADRHERTPAAHPSPIRRRVVGEPVAFGERELVVVDGVEQPHDLPLDLQRMRNRDVAVEQVANRLRDDRLAVAGRAVDEQRVAGIDRRAELIEHALPEDEMLKGIANAAARRGARRDLLPVVQVGDIARERHRRERRRTGCARERSSPALGPSR